MAPQAVERSVSRADSRASGDCPSQPSLSLLCFADKPPPEVPQAPLTWASATPKSFHEWSYRCTPRPPPQPAKRPTGRARRPCHAGERRAVSQTLPPTLGSKGAHTPRVQSGTTRATSSRNSTRPPSSLECMTRPSSCAPIQRRTSTPTMDSPDDGPLPSGAGSTRPQSSLDCATRPSSCATPQRPQQQHTQQHAQQRPTELSSGFAAIADEERTPTPTEVRSSSPADDVVDPHPSSELCDAVATSLFAITRAEQLAMASEAVGAWARGPVSAAIRARAIVRLVTGRAVRRLVYLYPDAGRNDASREGSSMSSSEQSLYNSVVLQCPRPPKPLGFRRRPNRVPENSVLGQMILRDPERATKYSLVAVPAWGRGTASLIHQPVSLPQLKTHESTERKNLSFGRVSARDEFDVDDSPASSHGALEAWSLGSPVSDPSPAGLQSKWKKAQMAGRLIGRFRSSSKPQSDLSADVEAGAPIVNFSTVFSNFTDEQVDMYTQIFERHVDPFAKDTLSRKGMQGALHEAGLTPTKGTMPERMKEQQMLKTMQEQVIMYSRTNFQSTVDLADPIKDHRGEWALDEFLLTVAGSLDLRQKELEKDDKQMAKRYNIPVAEVDQLRKVFVRYDADASGSIDLPELSLLLHEVNLHPTDGEVQMILGDMKLNENGELNFGEFLQVMRSVAENLQPERQWRKQSSIASH